MENTLENKEKFFAQYYGQPILSDISHGFQADNEANNWHQLFENNYLELKPISSITDEDALQIAELLTWRKSIQETSIIAQTKNLLLTQSQTNLYRENWSDIIDKIRELGYAHKWNSLSVEKQIEYGWIKLKK